MLLRGHQGRSLETRAVVQALPCNYHLGQIPSLTGQFLQEPHGSLGVDQVLWVQRRPVAPRGSAWLCVALRVSGGHADLGLLSTTSLHEELCLSGEIYALLWGSQLLTGLLGCSGSFLDPDLGVTPNRGFLKKK